MFLYQSVSGVRAEIFISALMNVGDVRPLHPVHCFISTNKHRRLPLFLHTIGFLGAFPFTLFCLLQFARNKTKPSNKARADNLSCLALDEQHIERSLSLRDTPKPSLRPFGCLSWPSLTRPSHPCEPTHSVRQHHLTQSSMIGHATPSGHSALCGAWWCNDAEIIGRHRCLEINQFHLPWS